MKANHLFSDEERWRLILGKVVDHQLPSLSNDKMINMDQSLDWLYGREQGRGADLSPSQMTSPEWIQQIQKLFPKETIEKLESDAVNRYKILDVVTNKDVLSRIEPNETLLRAVLQTKHLMNQDVLELARSLVAKVVEKLLEKFKSQIRSSFVGLINPRQRSLLKIANNFDFDGTIRKNLHRYDSQTKKIAIEHPLFLSRSKKQSEKWQIILLIDQSGSMVSSVIHSAITASCLWSIPGLKTHLVAFDTEIVDLTNDCHDPVETLMKVQLGGGTDINKAMMYAAQLVENPRRNIIVLISDFYEGGNEEHLVSVCKSLCDEGSLLLGLAALDSESTPIYDRILAQKLQDNGAFIGAMTPGHLAEFVADAMRGKRNFPI